MTSHFEKINQGGVLSADLYKIYNNEPLKGGPSDLGMKILQKYKKIILIIPKPFEFHS